MLARKAQLHLTLGHRAPGLRCRGLATASSASLRAPLSRYEPDQFQDYGVFVDRVAEYRKVIQHPLTYAEKVLLAHTDEFDTPTYRRRESQLKLRPRRIACQDATAQMSLIQFISAGLESTAVPTTIHCDHLIVGRNGKEEDLPNALDAHSEVYDFMSSACKKYNMGFWKPGAGIIHQIVLENYAYPGGMMVGTDSHTPNAGGMGMIAIGVGGADAVDVMAGLPFELTAPSIIGVKLTGELSGWASPKDVINKLAGLLTVKGATGSIVEFFGPGTQTLPLTGMSTITNMGAETGATTSIFPYSPAMSKYLEATRRPELSRAAQAVAGEMCADEGAEYDQVIEIDLSALEPHINGPFTPDLATPVSKFADAVTQEEWPSKLTAGLIGSCTNSSFEDMNRAASVAQQAMDAGLTPKMPLLVSPGSEQVRSTLEKSKTMEVFEKLQSTILTNACGPCCGSWDRQDMKKGTKNSIITSYNRNFTGRLDSNPATHIFLSSPEVVMAKIFSDDLAFDPTKDSLTTPTGEEFIFNPPNSAELPRNGFENVDHVYTPPPTSGREHVEVQISPSSNRLQLLKPFKPWSGNDYENCLILIKVKGKCTTDHITPAGPWFRYRGHLGNISNNTLIGAVNADNGKTNAVRNLLTGEEGGVPDTARSYQEAGQPWVVIGDHNYGEGSSREHAALQPRYLGGAAIIAKSFARIHETNLKKQGILALKFVDEADHDRIQPSDRISIVGLTGLTPGRNLKLRVTPSSEGADGMWETEVSHTYSTEQVEYFKAGSALNLMMLRKKGEEAAAI
ncbi:putative aconitase [Hypoxylon trugodes]|uniref:putative aconitase n=1 Tax=Hypoxylon trugodes TaxID=326681 RepID=UPI00219B8452|nr:putative aconitase [Hypoxylon trugodes]KAI1387017.1 putative aconitase [Hypoxylon trugodes]